MKTIKTLAILLLIFSCSKDDEDCKCNQIQTDSATYYIQTCNPEFEESINNSTKSDRIWEQFQRENPCD